MKNNTLLEKAEHYATDILKHQLPSSLVFHNFALTEQLVKIVHSIGVYEELSDEDMATVQIAAWFIYTGCRDDYDSHKEKSLAVAASFLKQEHAAQEKTEQTLACLKACQVGNKPESQLERVLVDAKYALYINGDYKSQLSLLRKELLAVKGQEISEVESLKNHLKTILSYDFYTTYGQEVLQPARAKLKAKLEKRLSKLQKAVDENISSDLGITMAQLKSLKKKLQKAEGRPERGIETMFRLTSKNHLDLSGMADSKANIMISINSIIMSVVMGSLMSKLDSNEHLYYPTVILLGVNLASLIFAILSLRPNVSDGLFTREDIDNQKTNLLFFGNFHKMKREDYHWGMNKLMENANFLYSNLIDDIYFLGVVLARKYKLLRTAYNIFMYGMVVVVIAYIISLSFAEEPLQEAIIESLRE